MLTKIKKKGKLRLILYSILIIHILFLVILFNKILFSSEIYRKVYLVYVFILILSIAIIIYCIYKNLIKFYLAYFIIFVITAYFFEIRIFHTNSKNIIDLKEEISSKNGLIFDSRSRERYLKDRRIEEKNIFPSIRFKNLNLELKEKSIYPLSGVSMTQTILCNENGNFIEFFSDRFGYNNNDEVWDLKEIDFILIGDSFVLGNCVNREKNLLSNLEKLTNKRGLNLGYENSGPLMQYATIREFKEIIVKKKINKIIWLFYDFNDLRDLEIEMKTRILNQYLENKNFSQNLINKQSVKDSILKKIINNKLSVISSLNKNLDRNDKAIKIQNFKEILILKNLRSKINVKYLLPKNKISFDKNDQKNINKIFNNIKEIEKDLGVDLILFYLPTHTWKSNDEIIQIIKNKKIDVVDLYTELYEKKNRWDLFPYSLPGHFNPYGYKELSQIIFNFAFKD